MEIYVVKSGDTIFSIAARFGVSAARILTDNGIVEPARLVVGQSLLILLPEKIYTVGKGESLFSISAKTGIPVLELLRNNPYLVSAPYLPDGLSLVLSYKSAKQGGSINTCGFAYSSVRRNVFESALPYITFYIQFGYGFTLDGTILTVDDAELISLAHSNRASVLLSMSLIEPDGTFNTGKLTPLLTDMTFQNKVISGMLYQIKTRGAQGMDIDMEYIPSYYKSQFAAFAENAASQLHLQGYILNIDLAPKSSANQSGTLYEAHDYKFLGSAADYVFLMTYEWGYMYGPPMAVAPIKSVAAVLDYALTEIPPQKILLGIPNYAYDWGLPYEKGVTAAQVIGNLYAVTLAQSTGSAIEFDEAAKTPFYYYSDNSSQHVVWFEDARSMNAKYSLVSSKAISGCGYWNLMRPFPQAYLLLNYFFNINKLYP